MLRQPGKQRRLLRGRVVVNDGGPRPLQVRQIVEIVHEDIAALDSPGRNRGDNDGVRIQVAIVRDGGRTGDVPMNRFQETLGFAGLHGGDGHHRHHKQCDQGNNGFPQDSSRDVPQENHTKVFVEHVSASFKREYSFALR